MERVTTVPNQGKGDHRNRRSGKLGLIPFATPAPSPSWIVETGGIGGGNGVTHGGVPVTYGPTAMPIAATQSTSDLKGDHLSVNMFEVVGDGVADDTAALQAAVTAAANRTLLIPPAKSYYKVNGLITVPSNITILGEKATLIVQTKPQTAIFQANGQADVIISGLSLQGPGNSDYNPNGNTNAHLIEIFSCSSVRLEKLYLSKFGHAGIAFLNTKDLWITQCKIVGLDATAITDPANMNYNFCIVALNPGVGYGPIWITDNDLSQGVSCINSQDDTNDWHIQRNVFHDTVAQHGIYINPGKRGPVVVGNRFYNIKLDGLKLTKTTGDTEQCDGATIVGNQFNHCGNACINMGIASGTLPLTNFTIVGNNCEWSDYGINVTSAPGLSCVCLNFLIANNNINHCGNYGLRVEYTVARIQNNYINNIGGTGLILNPGSTSVIVYMSDNVITGAGNGQAYGGAGVLSGTQLAGMNLGPGFYFMHNNIVDGMSTVDIPNPSPPPTNRAKYTVVYFNCNVILAGANFFDPTYPNYYSGVTFLSAFAQSADGRFLIGDPQSGPAQPTAALEIRSTTRGFLLPNMTAAQMNAIASPMVGLQVWNSGMNRPNFWDGAAWRVAEVVAAPPDYIPYAAGTTIPSVVGYGKIVTMRITNTTATTITNFSGGANGTVLILIFGDSNTTIQRGGSITLDGGVNFVSALFRTLMLVYAGGVWHQVGKVSANG